VVRKEAFLGASVLYLYVSGEEVVTELSIATPNTAVL